MASDITNPAVYVEEVPSGRSPIASAPTSITAFVGHAAIGPVNEPVAIDSFIEFERVFGGLWHASALGHSVQQCFTNGGRRAVVVRVAGPGGDPAAELSGNATAMTGLHALRKTDVINLLCIPPIVTAAEPGAAPVTVDVPIAVWAEASRLCRDRRAMLLVDAPRLWDGSAAATEVALFSGLERPNAALYFPWLRAADASAGGAIRDYAPSGAIAGIISRTDAARGVWKAPAGSEATLQGVVGLSMNGQAAEPTRRQCERLASLGVNCLRSLPGTGHVIWGARTLDGADSRSSEWKYVSVRRLLLFIEVSIGRGIRWAVFEPNGEPLWVQIRSAVTDFLESLFRAGAFPGARTSRDAYFVKCDRTTMTQDDLNNGRLIVLVGVAPVKPAEFVIVRIGQTTASAPHVT